MKSTPHDLIQIVDAALASAVARSGRHLACRPGCSQCCHGVFEIAPLDAARLREGLTLAAMEDPAKAARILHRIEAARQHLAPFFPGDPAAGTLTGTAEAIELFEEWAHADPCPILEPASQTCDLYAHRPVLCRTFGPPIRNDAADPTDGLAICELCFSSASEPEIAAAEMDSSFRTLEAQLEAAHAIVHPLDGPTVIPFAFPPSAPQAAR